MKPKKKPKPLFKVNQTIGTLPKEATYIFVKRQNQHNRWRNFI